MRRRVFPLVTACLTVAVAAAGCGVADEQTRPGVAAEVADETLELSTVDRAVEDYCALRTANPQATAVSTAFIRGDLVVAWLRAVAVGELAEERGVPVPSDTIEPSAVEASWSELGTVDDDNYDSFEWLTWIQQRLGAPVEQIGADALAAETGQPASGEPAYNRGVELVTEWLADEAPDVNPVFGDYDAKTAGFQPDSALSLPVSEPATDVSAGGDLTPEQASALPASQRCGPVPAAQVQPGA